LVQRGPYDFLHHLWGEERRLVVGDCRHLF
jgi:hypothetical protein